MRWAVVGEPPRGNSRGTAHLSDSRIPRRLTAMTEHLSDREAARKTWKEFSDDPGWKKVYAESHKNGALVNKVESVFLEPTDYSARK